MAGTRYVAVSLVVIIVAAIIIYAAVSTIGPTRQFFVQITDPPQVPNGTTALIINYSGLMVHQAGSGANGFINLNSAGSVNLMNLSNVSLVIGIGSVPIAASVDIVRFNITSASITINGTTYNVSVPDSMLSVAVNGGSTLNESGALVDFTPTVVQIYQDNQTVFALVPSAVAIRLDNGQFNNTLRAHIGQRLAINGTTALMIRFARPNVTVSDPMLSSSGNITTLSLTVTNNANRSVVLNHLIVAGFMKAVAARSFIPQNATIIVTSTGSGGIPSDALPGSRVSGNVTVNSTGTSGKISGSLNVSIKDRPMEETSVYVNMTGVGHLGNYTNSHLPGANISAVSSIIAAGRLRLNGSIAARLAAGGINSTDIQEIANQYNLSISQTTAASWGNMLRNSLNASVAADLRNINTSSSGFRVVQGEAAAFQRNYHGVLNFVIESNGSLELPIGISQIAESSGYTLASGQAVTLKFTGTASFRNGRISVTPINNQTYRIGVTGQQGVAARTNVTAG